MTELLGEIFIGFLLCGFNLQAFKNQKIFLMIDMSFQKYTLYDIIK